MANENDKKVREKYNLIGGGGRKRRMGWQRWAGSHTGNESQKCSTIYSRVGIVFWDLKLLHLRGERLLRKRIQSYEHKYKI